MNGLFQLFGIPCGDYIVPGQERCIRAGCNDEDHDEAEKLIWIERSMMSGLVKLGSAVFPMVVIDWTTNRKAFVSEIDLLSRIEENMRKYTYKLR